MNEKLVQTRKHWGEVYEFYYISPSYEGEVGICGVEIEPYIRVVTPKNCFGYSNRITLGRTIHFDETGHFDGYVRIPNCHERGETDALLRRLTKQIIALEKKLGIEGETRTVFD